LLRLLGYFTDATVVFSEVGRERVLEKRWCRPDRLVVIPNGVPQAPLVTAAQRATIRESMGTHTGDILLMSIGGLRQEKDFPFLLAVMAELESQEPSRYRLAIVGDGPLSKELRVLIRGLRLDTRVTLLGARSDARRLLAGADLFVNTSVWEAMPISIIEAMCAGIPVLAPDVGDISALLRGGGGRLLERSVVVFAEAVRDLGRDPAARSRVGLEGQRNVLRNFSMSASARSYERLYRRIVRARGSRSGNHAPSVR
jgi:glycosyltransferase involved in cell wall biosynthesis